MIFSDNMRKKNKNYDYIYDVYIYYNFETEEYYPKMLLVYYLLHNTKF